MPKREDIQSILVIGAGPIVIGQACEFDYSGTQACQALKAEGYRIILINSNPATVMTDPNLADKTYIEPINVDIITKIIDIERPDAILPTVGGQTALNCAMKLADEGILAKYNVEMLGANREAIEKAENRKSFGEAMRRIGLNVPKNIVVNSLEEAKEALKDIGLPAVIRPSFTLGGTGGGIAYNYEEFEEIVERGLDCSPTTEVMIDRSIVGWKEYEMEVVRDKNNNSIIVCSIENIDPMGVHTGDSITVAPALTLTDKEYQKMRDASIAVLAEIGVETGGSNVQFAVNPKDGELLVIEMNPRVSRSSALASKATGFPIAKVAALLAVGYTLDEITNDCTGKPASFEPTIDYVITKIPRFAFEKFKGSSNTLSTAMKSVGEVMGIGRSFIESFNKALSSMENGNYGLKEIDLSKYDDIKSALGQVIPDRIFVIAQAIREGISLEDIHEITKYDYWFLEQIQVMIEIENELKLSGLPKNKQEWLNLKRYGFTDQRIAEILNLSVEFVYAERNKFNVNPIFKRIDTCAAEFNSDTSYLYSSYEGDHLNGAICEADVKDREKIIILGSGPNRIGQGIEFDYCCVQAAYALKEAGFYTIMINCNPETVSTDYDTVDSLYFEPLTFEHVAEIIKKEQKKGHVKGLVVQYGGQTPLKIAKQLEQAGFPILGTTTDIIDVCEDRKQFKEFLHSINLRQPANDICYGINEVEEKVNQIGLPIVIRPSYVLGGRGMEVIFEDANLQQYLNDIGQEFISEGPILIDSFLEGAIEVDVDAICDGENVFIAGVMEHIEEAGIHSGDSSCSLPPFSLSDNIVSIIKDFTRKIGSNLKVCGLMNVQYAVKDNEVYVLEVNPRASRTTPFVAKATGVNIAQIGAQIMAGKKLTDFDLNENKKFNHVSVKSVVFPFARFQGVDVILGPEMKSTGESMGIDASFDIAFAKAYKGIGGVLPRTGTVFISVRDNDKFAVLPIAKDLKNLGFNIIATGGTAKFLNDHNIAATPINKVMEGRPHIVDAMKNNQVNFVINTTSGSKAIRDSFTIRQTALMHKIPYSTTLTETRAIVRAMQRLIRDEISLEVKAIQEYI